jgi:hypothetical protein
VSPGNKKIVTYVKLYNLPQVGFSVYLHTVDHPNLSNEGKLTITSKVVEVRDAGVFETLNTIYVPETKASA